ncbi:hypothetical protein L6164_035041 [Bauhinia variegata]|uniref:Uncharacterized protein n=1 Tax=Bauhinia variegata TaxID=167791 RepID=A0ACB9KWP2_BAUVA|nr:hypothetical protein L6164_035041 [Bauhinia variegata]
MKSRWLFWKFNSQFPSWTASLSSLFKAPTCRYSFSATSKFILNHADISFLLSVCGIEGNLQLGSSLHACIIKQIQYFDFESHDGSWNALYIWNSLLSKYSKCGELSDALKLFDRCDGPEFSDLSKMIHGFEREITVGNALIT